MEVTSITFADDDDDGTLPLLDRIEIDISVRDCGNDVVCIFECLASCMPVTETVWIPCEIW